MCVQQQSHYSFKSLTVCPQILTGCEKSTVPCPQCPHPQGTLLWRENTCNVYPQGSCWVYTIYTKSYRNVEHCTSTTHHISFILQCTCVITRSLGPCMCATIMHVMSLAPISVLHVGESSPSVQNLKISQVPPIGPLVCACVRATENILCNVFASTSHPRLCAALCGVRSL